MYKGTKLRNDSTFPIRNNARGERGATFEVVMENCQLGILYPVKMFFKS